MNKINCAHCYYSKYSQGATGLTNKDLICTDPLHPRIMQGERDGQEIFMCDGYMRATGADDE